MRFLWTLIAASSAFAELQVGTLPTHWQSSAWIVHEYNNNLTILRQPGLSHYEKPFVYLLFGTDRALLLDTGAGKPGIGAIVKPLLDKRGNPPLIVIHSHGHSDHTAGDAELRGMSGVTVVPPAVDELKKTFGIESWPEGAGTIDLGGRILDALPIPGHDAVSIALYDRRTGILLTGDSVYPGRLYVRDWTAFRDSIDRLLSFTALNPVAHVLGTHIEQTRTPFLDYPRGTQHQPDEHALDLGRAHLLELQRLLIEGTPNQPAAARDFTIVPVRPLR